MPNNNLDHKPRYFIHNDGQNLFYRQIHSTNPALGLDSQIGMALHMILYSMKKEFTKWNGTHCIFYMEGRSWRKDVDPNYKANRKVTFSAMTEREQEDQLILQEAFDDLVVMLDSKTNVTVLRNPTAEADDMIAMFIDSHPNDVHVVISSDSDFFQLLRYDNVMLYDPVKDIQIRRDGIFDDDGNRLEFTLKTDAKIKVGGKNPAFVCEEKWYEYALFLKCVRGDKSDNIFPAYPGVREKGSKNTVGIREAYQDKTGKGYSWNNFMLQKWIDHNSNEFQVKDKFALNKLLIDLQEIPDNIKTECLDIIEQTVARPNVPAVEIGSGFMRFAGKWDLKKIGNNAEAFMPMLKSKYTE